MTMLAMRNSMVGMLACAIMLGAMNAAAAQTQLKVMVFPGLSNFSIYAAQHKNLFAKHGLAVELLYTPNSDVLRNGLAKGDHQIAHAAVDNAVAMVELAKADVVIVTGGETASTASSFSRRSTVMPIFAARRSWSTPRTPPTRCCSTRCSRTTASTKATTRSGRSAVLRRGSKP